VSIDPYPVIRHVEPIPVEHEGQHLVFLRDPEGYANDDVAVPHHVYYLLTLFDGEHSLADLVAAYADKFDDVSVNEDQIVELVKQIDRAHLLDNENFQKYRLEIENRFLDSPVRPAAHAGASYPDDPAVLREMIDGFFEPPEGPGSPQPGSVRTPVRAVIAPHIDFNRGGPCFAWAYRALADAPRPDVFVVFGTGHSARHPFVVSRKDFQTPFGTLETDQAVIDRLAELTDLDIFEDEGVHRTEHSIEFQTVFLKYLYPDSDITFIPILCGSFHEMIEQNHSPAEIPLVANFFESLKQALKESGKSVCFIAGVDFSHVGRRFGDPGLPDKFIEEVESCDRDALAAAEEMDPEAFFQVIAKAQDRTRICGTSSIYTMLQAMDTSRAELLKYDKTIDTEDQSMVSFASMAFY
jgi:hypothetical protein